MILPCRIHRTCRVIDCLPLRLFFAVFFLITHHEVMGQYSAGGSTSQPAAGGTTSQTGGAGKGYVPLEITSGLDFGYDDHVIGSTATANSSGQASFFTRENLVLTYDRPGEATSVALIGLGRFTQFLNAGTDDKEGNVTFALTHNFSTRLSFRADLYGSYQTEPNFQSNVGPENVRAPHFETHDIFSLTYHWLPRLATITSFTFERIKYEQTSSTTTAIGIAQNRFQDTFAQDLQFSLTKRTNLILEYRYLIVDYDTSPRDSTTHFALAGFDHHFTEHLLIHVLGGESFRSFENDGNTIDPYVETNVSYEGGNHSLSWITTYGVEQPSESLAFGNTTIRTGLNLTYRLTSRINSRLGVYYHHSENQGPSGTTSSSSPQDALQTTLSLNYTINKHFAAHINYEYTSQSSSGAQAGYSRNQYFAGVTYSY